MSTGSGSLREIVGGLIRSNGPLAVHDYMAICLGAPSLGYYRSREAIGGSGDFVTAPEISQVFGELLGLWAVVVWHAMGSPSALRLVEIGPGRGTMLADALRAARIRPEFIDALSVDLVETSEALRGEQRRRLEGLGAEIAWHEALAAIPADRPTVLLANEVIDAMPVFQFVRRSGDWRERAVTLAAQGALAFTDREPSPAAARLLPLLGRLTAAEGDIAELRDHCELAANLARLARNPFAGLFIDYGHAGPAVGDTLQAVRHHAYVDPLALPGQTDLTAQVDFPLLRDALAAAGLAVEPILPQGELLGRLGILDRARRLAHLNPQESNSIEMAVARLVSPAAMGQRFKALAVRSRDLAPLPGFHSPALPCSP